MPCRGTRLACGRIHGEVKSYLICIYFDWERGLQRRYNTVERSLFWKAPELDLYVNDGLNDRWSRVGHLQKVHPEWEQQPYCKGGIPESQSSRKRNLQRKLNSGSLTKSMTSVQADDLYCASIEHIEPKSEFRLLLPRNRLACGHQGVFYEPSEQD